ncbi:MAG: DUF2182 domain-containing protein, partial [Pseudomonadota bacterium]|nr:DUF2182 domain-containing protein [Pseudomonadota bacterium]
RAAGGAGGMPSVLLSGLLAAGYFLVWTLLGAAVYAAGAAAALAAARLPQLARAVPLAVGLIVLAAGALQLTSWKARRLACCRREPSRVAFGGRRARLRDALMAWREGVWLGVHCSGCCLGLTAALLVSGATGWPTMLVATIGVSLERLSPAGDRIARIIGFVVIGAGIVLSLRAIRRS